MYKRDTCGGGGGGGGGWFFGALLGRDEDEDEDGGRRTGWLCCFASREASESVTQDPARQKGACVCVCVCVCVCGFIVSIYLSICLAVTECIYL